MYVGLPTCLKCAIAFPRNVIERRRQSIQFEMANCNCGTKKKTKTQIITNCVFIDSVNVDSQIKIYFLIYKF